MTEALFQLRIQHSYFSDGVYQPCRVAADGRTQEIIKRYGLISRMSYGAYGLYTSSQEETSVLVRYLNDQLDGEPLRFLLTSDAAQFSYITNLPPTWVGQVELSTKAVRTDGTAIQFIPSLSGRTVDKQNVIGIVSVFPEDLLAIGCGAANYRISFQSRSLHWHYYLVNRSQTKLHRPAVRNKNHIFIGPDPIVLPNGESGLCFTSGEMKFPLQQVPTVMFDLMDRLPASMGSEGESVEHCLIQGLPTPVEADLKRADTGSDVVSAMYVYL